jgi:hypothetical protein
MSNISDQYQPGGRRVISEDVGLREIEAQQRHFRAYFSDQLTKQRDDLRATTEMIDAIHFVLDLTIVVLTTHLLWHVAAAVIERWRFR